MKTPTSFHAQHAPMGAYFSFTCGHFGSTGGFGLQMGRPGQQDIYVGIKRAGLRGEAPLECLPFYAGATDEASAAFLVGQQQSASKPTIVPVSADAIKREYRWASDRWITK